jgi:N-glycosylase/DNA lyase
MVALNFLVVLRLKLIYCRSCALHGRIFFLKQDPTHLHYRVSWPKTGPVPLTSKSSARPSVDDDTESLIRKYFNLTPNLTQLYEIWSKADPNFKKRAPKFKGVRILKQDPWEALVGFICSSNNNIARISQMVSA